MRIGSSSISQSKAFSNRKIIKGLQPQKNKNFKPSVSDTFNTLNAWDPIDGTWSTDGNTVSSSSLSNTYPILLNYDLKSQDIVATMSLTSSNAGVAFWVQDANNWWAGVTFYTVGTFSYQSGQNCYTVGNAICYGNDGTRAWGCERTVCDPTYANRQVYNFYLKLIKAENGSVSDVTNVLLRTVCSATSSYAPCTVASNDNINGIEVSTSGNVITIRGRDDANAYYGSAISYTATSPNRGYQSGIVFAAGLNYPASTSVYQESSLVQDITIVGA